MVGLESWIDERQQLACLSFGLYDFERTCSVTPVAGMLLSRNCDCGKKGSVITIPFVVLCINCLLPHICTFIILCLLNIQLLPI